MHSPLLIDRDENIAKVVELLHKRKETHAIVIDKGRVVGVVSVKDVLKTILDRLRWGSQRVGKLYVSAIMTENPIYVDPETSVVAAARVMINNGISSVLVAKDLSNVESVGILTKRDILINFENLYGSKIAVSDVMTGNPIFVNPGTTIKHAEWILRENKISTLPVLEEGKLVGYLDARILALEIAWSYLKGDIKHTRTFIENTTVADVMAPPHFIQKDSSILSVVDLLVRKNVKGTPVLESERLESKLVGVVTETDIVGLLVKSSK
ncbi:MAG: CBS domain-containing protein [Crenarchaeota archaeon]|nr:CBS domain-containing protein [Thermoproteota archaeon]